MIKKAKKLPRRVLSFLLTMAVMVGMVALPVENYRASAALTVQSDLPDVYFVVPEAIYLTPVINSQVASTSSTFQWFVDSNATFNSSTKAITTSMRTGEYNSTNICFYYENANSVKISFRWLNASGSAYTSSTANSSASIYLGGSTVYCTNYSSTASKALSYTATSMASASITAGSSHSPSLGYSEKGCYIEWTASYVDSLDGKTKTVTNYTYVYKPYVQPVGAANRTFNDRGNNSYAQNISWVSGVHGSAANGTYYPKAATDRKLAPFSSSSTLGILAGNLYLQLPSYFNYTGINDIPSGDWLSNGTADAYFNETTFNWTNRNGDTGSSGDYSAWTYCVGATANLYVDRSRYTNMSQIPNLSTGLLSTDNEGAGNGMWFVGETLSPETSSSTGAQKNSRAQAVEKYNKVSNKFAYVGGAESWVGGAVENGLIFNGRINIAIPTASSSTKYVYTCMSDEDAKDTCYNFGLIPIQVYVSDKGTLRTAVNNAIKVFAKLGITDSSFNSNYYDTTSSYWTTFKNAYIAAAQALGKINAQYTNASTLASNLNSAIVNLITNKYALKTGMAYERHRALIHSGTGWVVGQIATANDVNESKSYYFGETVKSEANAYDHYTHYGYTLADSPADGEALPNTTSGTSVTHYHVDSTPKYYTHYYQPDTYTVTLDNQNARTGGTATIWSCYGDGVYLTNTDWVKMTINANPITVPTRTGYTFGGYYTAQNGGGTQYIDASGKLTSNLTSITITDDTTLYAKWTAHQYTVTFSGNGNTGGTMANQAFTFDAAQNLNANAFTRAYVVTYNYNNATGGNSAANATANAAFNGWEDRGSIVYHNGVNYPYTTFDAPFYAKANPDVFNVYGYNKLNLLGHYINSGFSEGRPGTGSAPGLYPNSANVNNLSTTDGATVPLYANWTLGSVTLPTPTRTGYIFAGWYTDSGFNNRVGFGGDAYTPTANTNLYAKWTPITYTVTYNGNGATGGSTANSVHTYDVAQNLTMNGYTKTGYTFAGWATSSTGAVVYNNAQSVTNLASTQDAMVTLYAKWTPDTFRIEYNGNRPAAASATPGNIPAATSLTYDAAAAVTATVPTLTGWMFNGWATSAGGAVVYASSAAVTKEAVNAIYAQVGKNGAYTLYAVWTQNKYNIAFNANGGTGSMDTISNVVYDVDITLPASAFTRVGYTFDGWATSAGGNVAYSDKQTVKNLTPANGATVTLYAKWEANDIKVYFIGNGNSDGGNEYTQDFEYDAPQALTKNQYKREYTVSFLDNNGTALSGINPMTAAYIFTGWNKHSDGSDATYNYTDGQTVTNPNGSTGGTTFLYAQWQAAGISLPILEKDGYIFAGWAEAQNATEASYNGVNQFVPTKNITLYAVWYSTAEADSKVELIQTETEVLKGIDEAGNPIYEGVVSVYEADQFRVYAAAYANYQSAKTLFEVSPTAENNAVLLRAAQNLVAQKYPAENKIVSKYFDDFYVDGTGHSVRDMNLNHYKVATLDTAKGAKTAGQALLTANAVKQKELNDSVLTMAKCFKNTEAIDTTTAYKTYETKAAASSFAKLLGENEDITSINYVYSGKGNYTYYCYTNSKTPVMYLSVEDAKASENRVCYPTKSEMVNSTGTANTYSLETRKVNSNAYTTYLNSGLGTEYTGTVNGAEYTGAEYYNRQSVVKLTPTFTADKETVTYTIKSSDDAYVPNYADTTSLSGKNETRPTATADAAVTPENTITIVIDYHPGDSFGVTSDQVNADEWLKQFHLFRNSGGASNWELPLKGDAVYTVDTNSFGQMDTGSFVYTFITGATDIANGILSVTDPVNNAASVMNIIKDNYSEVSKAPFTGTNKGGTGRGYQTWNNATWSFNYYPQSQAYSYVHLVDRWGNTVDEVVAVGNIDAIAAQAEQSLAGEVTVTEDGGSGIETMTLNSGVTELIADENSSFENNVYKTTGNTVKVYTGEANKSYNLGINDKATNATTAAVKTDSEGMLTLTVEDACYESGIYTFTLNGMEINLYSDAEIPVSKVISVEYTPSKDYVNDFRVKVEGRADKVRFIEPDEGTRTYDRYHDRVTIVSYNAAGEEVDSLSRDLAYEIWTINAFLPEKEMRATAKYAGEWCATYTFTVKLSEGDTEVYSMELSEQAGNLGAVKTTVVTGADAKGVRMLMEDGSTTTYDVSSAERGADGKLTFTCKAWMNHTGENVITVQVRTRKGWVTAGTLNYWAV